MKLIKVNKDHFIIVDDSEIKEGDWVINKRGRKKPIEIENLKDDICEGDEKITHSTQPLEKGCGSVIKDGTMLRNVGKELCYDKIKPLYISEIKELIGEVDVEKKAWQYNPVNKLDTEFIRAAYITGYNQSLEDNKDKKYTAEDMLTIRNALVSILPVGDVTAWDMIQAISKYTKWFDDYVESVYQPKTEWEVKIVDGKIKLI